MPAITETPAGPLGDDLYPALQKLSNFFKEHVKVVAPLILLLMTQSTSAFHDWTSALHHPEVLLAVLAMYHYYSGANPTELRSLGSYQLLIPTVAFLVVTQQPLPNEWANVAIVLFAVHYMSRRHNEEGNEEEETQPKFFLFAMIALALAPSLLRSSKEPTSEPTQESKPVQIPNVGILLLLYVAYQTHLSMNDSGSDTRTSTEISRAFQTVWKHTGSSLKAAFIVAVVCYAPVYHGLPLQYQVWVHCLIIATIAVAGYFAPAGKFWGPLRYGYLAHYQHFSEIASVLVDWWVYAIFFIVCPFSLPFLALGILAIVLAAWIKVYQEYTLAWVEITEGASKEVSRATLALTMAREYTSAIEGYRKQMLKFVSIARRDALLARSVKATDFFDCTETAWAALDGVIQPVADMVTKAGETLYAAQNAEDAQEGMDMGGDNNDDDDDDELGDDDDDDFGGAGGGGGLARELFDAATEAKEKAEKVQEKLKTARETVRFSRQANNQHGEARGEANNHASNAVGSAKQLESKIFGSANELSSALTLAARVDTMNEQILTAATAGEMALARAILDSMKLEANAVEEAKRRLLSSMENARGVLLSFMGVA